MKVFSVSLTLLFCLLAVHAPATTSSFVVGVSGGYPPYYYEKDGVLTGFCIDLVDAIALEMGLEVTYKSYPWKRLLISAEKGEVDAIMPLFRTEEREEYLIFKGLELAYETNHLFISTDSPVSYRGTLKEIASARIGVVSGYSYGNVFDSFQFPHKIITLNDKHLIEMFTYDRFDIGVGNRYVIGYYANMEGVADTLKFLDPPITKEPLYIGFARLRNHAHLAGGFAKTLQDFKTTAEYRELIDKYYMTGQD